VVACIPVYNEEKTIGGVVLKARRYLDRVVVREGFEYLIGRTCAGFGSLGCKE